MVRGKRHEGGNEYYFGGQRKWKKGVFFNPIVLKLLDNCLGRPKAIFCFLNSVKSNFFPAASLLGIFLPHLALVLPLDFLSPHVVAGAGLRFFWVFVLFIPQCISFLHDFE